MWQDCHRQQCLLSDVARPVEDRLLTQNLCCEQGYGTVRFTTKDDAEKAIADFHGTDLEGRTLAVKIDKYATAHPNLATPPVKAFWLAAKCVCSCCHVSKCETCS